MVGGSQGIGSLFYRVQGVGHGHTGTGFFQHIDVVLLVSEGQDLMGADAEVAAKIVQGPSLIDP